jgi:hypothetical protein
MSDWKIQERAQPSFHNNRSLLKKIDALPDVPEWSCEIFEITGDRVDGRDASGTTMLTEEVELWKRDPVECIKELIGNPAFRKHMQFAPERVFEDMDCKNQKFDNMWRSEWWWDLQVIVLHPSFRLLMFILYLESLETWSYGCTCNPCIGQDASVNI